MRPPAISRRALLVINVLVERLSSVASDLGASSLPRAPDASAIGVSSCVAKTLVDWNMADFNMINTRRTSGYQDAVGRIEARALAESLRTSLADIFALLDDAARPTSGARTPSPRSTRRRRTTRGLDVRRDAFWHARGPRAERDPADAVQPDRRKMERRRRGRRVARGRVAQRCRRARSGSRLKEIGLLGGPAANRCPQNMSSSPRTAASTTIPLLGAARGDLLSTPTARLSKGTRA